MSSASRLPKARFENIVSQEAGDEVLVFDKKFHQAHCLSPLVASLASAIEAAGSPRLATSIYNPKNLPPIPPP